MAQIVANFTDDPLGCKLFITLPNEKIIDVNIDPNDTVLALKNIIKQESNIPIEQQHIVFQGKALLNEQSLKDYDIPNEAQLIVIQMIPTKDPLAKLLTKHNLFNDLYKTLTDNDFDLEMLQNDLKEDEIETFAKNLQFNTAQKVKFRKLMRIIANNKIVIQEDDKMEVAVIGNIAVGKTSLIRRYVEDKFAEDVKSTFGIGYSKAYERLSDNSTMKIEIWDTAGQERFDSICKEYYRKADVMLVCYDVGEVMSLESCNKWRKKIEEYADDDVFVILVACKTDLCDADHESQAETVLQQREWIKLNAAYCECSAKTGENVQNVFLTAAEMVAQRRKIHGNIRYQSEQSVLRESPPPPSKKKCSWCSIL